MNVKEKKNDFPYSPTEMLENVQCWDNTCEVVCYISHVDGTTISNHTSPKQYFRFLINNNDGQIISVIAWNEQALRVQKLKLQCNQVIHLDGLRVRSVPSQHKTGTQPYEFCIESNTVISILGERQVGERVNTGQYEFVELKNVGKSTGIIKTEGWIQKNFSVLLNHFNNTIDQFYGFITDEEFKLEVKVKYFAKDHKFERGQRIELIGSLQRDRTDVYFLVESMSDMKALDKPVLPLIKILASAKNIIS